MSCLKKSTSEFTVQRFEEHDRSFGTQEIVTDTGARRMSKAKKYTQSSEFQKQLQDLMQRIRSTEPHFVRCIKPNQKNMAGVFERKSVVKQLRYQGVLQAVEVSRADFPMRLRHRQGVVQFRCVAAPEVRLQVEAQVLRGNQAVAAQTLFNALSEDDDFGLERDSWAVGSTLVFLKREAVEVLSTALAA